MPELSVGEFVDCVERSGLISRDTLSEAMASLDKTVDDSGVVGASLIRAGLLSEWQCQRLLEGRHGGFFLGKYKLLDPLGRGGMARVFLAEHTVMHRRVAIKILPPRRAEDPEYLRRFHLEARAVAAMDHRHVVRAFDVDQVDNYHFLVMEYIEGRDVQKIVTDDGPLPFRVAADFARQAAEGLAHAHTAGLIHRDVKPGNLLVDTAGVVKVLDLGLAHFTERIRDPDSESDEEIVVGTIDYIAPEQARGQHIDGRTDIYGLGATLYFMLTGYPPFPTGTSAERLAKHLKAEPQPIAELRGDVPLGLAAICRRMMSKSLEKRYASMEEVHEILSAWLDDKSINLHGKLVDPSQLTDEELMFAPDEGEGSKKRITPPPPPPEEKPSATPPQERRAPTPSVAEKKKRVVRESLNEQLLKSDVKSFESEFSRQLPVAKSEPEKDDSIFTKPVFWIAGGCILVGLMVVVAIVVMSL